MIEIVTLTLAIVSLPFEIGIFYYVKKEYEESAGLNDLLQRLYKTKTKRHKKINADRIIKEAIKQEVVN